MTKKHIFALFCLFISLGIFAQQDSSAVLFKRAKEHEASGNRKEARRIMLQLVSVYPADVDFGLFNARLKAYDEEFKAAISDLELLQQKHPSHYEILSSLADISRWDGQYELSLQTSDSLLKYYPQDQLPYVKKALVHEDRHEYDEAEKLLLRVLEKLPGDKEILQILERVRSKNYKQHMGVFYYNTSFIQSFAPWHFGGVEYMRKTRFAPLRAVASIASRFEEQSLQFELEAYPKLGKKSYLYAGAGFSDGKNLFPDWRTSLELYRVFPRKWEASLGFRNLNYVSKLNNGSDMNFVFTASLGKYFPKYWMYYRNFARFETSGSSFSHLLHLRRYLEDEDRYLALSLIQGANPMFVGWLNQFSTLNTTGAALDYQFKWKSKNIGKLSFLYEKEEYLPGMERDRLTAMMTYLKRF
ncbi:MAG: hypothetical protein K0R65_2845 [Crocinitomicaceae bacterium]|jgi:YaiO family outer membrane protein|nr:hypothetical protein [Crocinitomicaceae bacterium]